MIQRAISLYRVVQDLDRKLQQLTQQRQTARNILNEHLATLTEEEFQEYQATVGISPDKRLMLMPNRGTQLAIADKLEALIPIITEMVRLFRTDASPAQCHALLEELSRRVRYLGKNLSAHGIVSKRNINFARQLFTSFSWDHKITEE